MKKWIPIVFFCLSSLAFAESTKTVFNPFTNKLDFITAVNGTNFASGSGITVSCVAGVCTFSATGSAASSLQVSQSGVNISSPTASLNFYGGDFILNPISGTTAQIALNPATTDFIQNTSLLQSATFYVSSGTVSGTISAANFTKTTGGVNTGVVFQNGQTYANSSTFEWNGTTMSATRVTGSTATWTVGEYNTGPAGITNTYGITSGSMTVTTAGTSGSNYLSNINSTPGAGQLHFESALNGTDVFTVDPYGIVNSTGWYSLDGTPILSNGNAVQSVFVGNGIGQATSASSDVCIGFNTCNSITNGSNNTIIGHQAGATLSSGQHNTCVGHFACNQAGSTQHNTGIGSNALGGASFAGTDNIAIGYLAGDAITSGSINTVISGNGVNNLSSGNYNTIISNGGAITTGNENTIIGGGPSVVANALTTGSSNTYVGSGDTGGSGNANNQGVTLLGFDADAGTSSQLTNATAIGYNALVTSSNTMRLGGTGVNAEQVVGSTFSFSSGTVTGQLSVGTLQGASLSACGDSSHALSWSGGNFGCQSISTGGGGVSGQINTANQFAAPYYSVTGSSNVISGSTGINLYNSSFTVTNTNTGAYDAVVVTSTGTGSALKILGQGSPGGGVQQRKGVVTIGDDTAGNPISAKLVIVDSTTDSQVGAGQIEVWEDNPNNNDPVYWEHRVSNNSGPDFRVDAPAPNMEIVATSTDTTVGRGKWEPWAVPSASEILQVNSRCWDNTSFENAAYWEPINISTSVGKPGLFMKASDSTGCDSGIVVSSNTSGANFFTLNNHTVGITGPLNVASGSWRVRISSTIPTQGQIMYMNGADSSGDYPMSTTFGGTTGNALHLNTSGAPTWVADLAESSATATYLQLSSATATYLQLSSATATYLQLSSATASYFQKGTTVIPIANGGTGTGSTLTGIVRGGNPLTASEISGDATTSGSNSLTMAASQTHITSISPSGTLTLGSAGNSVSISSAAFIGGSTFYYNASSGTLAIGKIAWGDGTVQVSSPTTGGGSGNVSHSGTIAAQDIAKFTDSTGATISSATAANIVGLFSTCSGIQYLGADGACHTASGSGDAVLAATQTWTGGNTWTSPNPAAFSFGVTAASMTLTSTSDTSNTKPLLQLNVNNPVAASNSVGGAINVTMTNSTGTAITVYSNRGSDANGNLLNLRADNSAFAQNALFIDYRGSANAATIRGGTGATSYALNVVGQSTGTSAFQASGTEAAVATFKITHSSPTVTPGQSDANASAVSINLTGAGTQAQGLFIDAPSRTTGKLLNVRNGGVEQLVEGADGTLTNTFGVVAATVTASTMSVTGGSMTISGAGDMNLNGMTLTMSPMNTPTTTNSGAVWQDSNVNTLLFNMQGTTLALTGVIYTANQSSTTANNTATTNILPAPSFPNTLTFPANFFTVGKTLNIIAIGTFTYNSTNLAGMNISFDSTVLASSDTFIGVNTPSSEAWTLNAQVTCRSTGASGQFVTTGFLNLNNTRTTSLNVTLFNSGNTIDTTAAHTLKLNWHWATANSLSSFTLTNAIIKVAD